MVSRIVDFLKSQPNYVASYEQVKSECNVSVAKTFKQPQLKKFCDTNLVSSINVSQLIKLNNNIYIYFRSSNIVKYIQMLQKRNICIKKYLMKE